MMSDYFDFYRGFPRYVVDHPQERAGQAAFNYIARLRPDIGNLIVRSEVDAFHDDSKVEAMLLFMEEHWADQHPVDGTQESPTDATDDTAISPKDPNEDSKGEMSHE